MFKNNTFLLVTIILICLSCDKPLGLKPISTIYDTISQANLEDYDFKNWHFKDIEIDTLPGISLRRVYDSIIPKLDNSEKIIVAVLDMSLDINHKDLKDNIWINEDEISNNGIDDDENGFIDDIHGWNFIGNKRGEKSKYVNFEVVRLLNKFNSFFNEKDTLNLSKENKEKFDLYNQVKNRFKARKEYYIDKKNNYSLLYNLYFTAKDKIEKYVGDRELTLKMIDSLKSLHLNGVTETDYLILEDCIKNNIDDNYVVDKKEHYDNIVNKILNLNFNDRMIQNDDPDDIKDTSYGNNTVNGHLDFMSHGTKMAGIISNIFQNSELEIMSLPISAYGDEHDKDIALAIRYAVDNGANVINMSFYKEFSLHKEWVFEAFKYAEEHDVLIVGIAGNDGINLNDINYIYPNDNENNKNEVSNNFIMLGASSYSLNTDLLCDFSSYGNYDIDLFAPGTDIYTTLPNDEYTNTSNGTSSAAAITSGVAALIRSYYPKLTASQVKHILIDSGVEYTFDVKVGDTMLPFNTLSKSGKILNAYNAMIMADSISRAN